MNSNSDTLVAKIIDEYRVVINRGSDSGVANGQRYLIYEIGEAIIDPQTGADLGRLEIIKGKIIITHVQPQISTAESITRMKIDTVTTKNADLSGLLGRSFFGPTEQVREITSEHQEKLKDVKVGDRLKRLS